MENSTIFKNGKSSISIRAIYTMAMINSQRLPEDTMTLNMLRVVNSDHRELEISLSHHLLFSMRLGEYSMSCLMVPAQKIMQCCLHSCEECSGWFQGLFLLGIMLRHLILDVRIYNNII